MTCLAAASADARYLPQVQLTLRGASFNDGKLELCLNVEPPFSTPWTTPLNGQFEITFQEETAAGKWQDAQPQPQTSGWEYDGGPGSPTSTWKVRTKLLQPFSGRVCVKAKKTGMKDSEPVYREIEQLQKVVKVESDPPPLNAPGVRIDLPAGVAVTFRLQAHDIATGDLLVLENGRYHLQIEGPGATGFTIDSGHSARTLQLVGGEATFTLTGRPGAEAAWLVGFDADRGPDDPDALSPIRLRLVVR